MPVPNAAGDGHYAVVERVEFIAVRLRDAAQAFSPADSVFDFDAAACVGAVVSALRLGQGRRGAFFAASGLAMGQTRGG